MSISDYSLALVIPLKGTKQREETHLPKMSRRLKPFKSLFDDG